MGGRRGRCGGRCRRSRCGPGRAAVRCSTRSGSPRSRGGRCRRVAQARCAGRRSVSSRCAGRHQAIEAEPRHDEYTVTGWHSASALHQCQERSTRRGADHPLWTLCQWICQCVRIHRVHDRQVKQVLVQVKGGNTGGPPCRPRLLIRGLSHGGCGINLFRDQGAAGYAGPALVPLGSRAPASGRRDRHAGSADTEGLALRYPSAWPIHGPSAGSAARGTRGVPRRSRHPRRSPRTRPDRDR